MKLSLWPSFGGEDNGDGGVRQVWQGQVAHLPAYGIDLTEDADEADVLAAHIAAPPAWYVRYPRKPLVAHVHGFYWSEYEWQGWALKANADVMELVRLADIVTVPSEWVAVAVRRHTMRDVRVVPHGVTWARSQQEPGDYVLWNKTRPDPVCDPDPMARLAALMPETRFISTFGNSAPNVELTGRVSHREAVDLVAGAGVYLCTARETFGVGTLEALASGVPVVGFRWGGQAEFVEHGKDGWLVDPGDIEGLAEGVRWAFENREALIPACQKKAAQFTWERACEQYAAIYREALERRQEPRPKVSVIVTAYNLEQYLPETLESVAEQTLADFECIVVDDASPDNCGKIAREWAKKDPRFKAIHNRTNQYLAESRNIGIAASRGEYILPLDADDTLPPTALETLATALDTNRRIDIAYGGVEFVENDGKRWHSGWPMAFRLDLQLRGPGQLLPYSSMYRRRVWEMTGGYRARCRSSEDQDFWLRAPSYGFRPMKVTEADTLIYRNRGGSMSQTEGWREHRPWYPWARDINLAPAGAVTLEQLPIPSCDPPAISVIVPVGPGHERLLYDAVDSIDAQTFRQWECIVVNDSGRPLPPLPSWVRVVDNHGPRGVASARNAGIQASRAALFLPLDADDYLQPNALKTMFDAFVQTGDIIYPDFWEEDDDGVRTIHECDDYDPDLITGKKRQVSGENYVREGMIHAVTALTPKAAWRAVGGYDEELPGWEDWAFQLAVANKGICERRLGLPVWTYRKHTGARRDDNWNNFEASKQGLLKSFAQLWDGGKRLMACSSCGKRATVSGPPRVAQGFGMGPTPEQLGNSAVLVRYTGTIVGKRRYKGQGGITYTFDANDPPKYVTKADYDGFFARREDFELVSPPSVAAPDAAEAPALIAEGPPPAKARTRAARA